MHTPTHPHAQAAIHLAAHNQPHRSHVRRELALSGPPRSLYTLARILRAEQMMDQINAAHPAVVAKTA
jgi:hypothetical protein